MSLTATMLADSPWSTSELCASWPRTVTSWTAMPLCPVTTRIRLGSPTMAQRGAGIVFAMRAIIAGAPAQPTSSS